MSWQRWADGALRFLSRAADVVTADSPGRCLTRATILFLGTVAVAMAAFGTFAGASAAVTGQSLSTVTSTIHGVEIEVWNTFAREGAVARSIYGLGHWIVVVMILAADAGARAGFAVPALAYVAEGAQFLMILVVAAAVMNAIEAAWLSWTAQTDRDDGGEPA